MALENIVEDAKFFSKSAKLIGVAAILLAINFSTFDCYSNKVNSYFGNNLKVAEQTDKVEQVVKKTDRKSHKNNSSRNISHTSLRHDPEFDKPKQNSCSYDNSVISKSKIGKSNSTNEKPTSIEKSKNTIYLSAFNQIIESRKDKDLESISVKLQELYQKISQDHFPERDSLLDYIANFTYIDQVRVSEKKEKVLVKEEYTKEVWVEPIYEERRYVDDGRELVRTLALIGSLGNLNLNRHYRTKKVKIKDGYYKTIKIDAEYKTKINPAHTQETIVNPYLGKKSVIDANREIIQPKSEIKASEYNDDELFYKILLNAKGLNCLADLYILDEKSNKLENITNDIYENSYASWLPDNKAIIYCSKINGKSNIYLYDMHKKRNLPLCISEEYDFISPSINEDGVLAFIRTKNNDFYDIVLSSPDDILDENNPDKGIILLDNLQSAKTLAWVDKFNLAIACRNPYQNISQKGIFVINIINNKITQIDRMYNQLKNNISLNTSYDKKWVLFTDMSRKESTQLFTKNEKILKLDMLNPSIPRDQSAFAYELNEDNNTIYVIKPSLTKTYDLNVERINGYYQPKISPFSF